MGRASRSRYAANMWHRLIKAAWIACLILSITIVVAGVSVQRLPSPTFELTQERSVLRIGIGFRGHRFAAWLIIPSTKFVPWNGTADFSTFGAATTSDT